jgi:hypothetical protein
MLRAAVRACICFTAAGLHLYAAIVRAADTKVRHSIWQELNDSLSAKEIGLLSVSGGLEPKAQPAISVIHNGGS